MDRPLNSILIVGEDLPLLQALAFTLKRREYAVVVSSNPREALMSVEVGSNAGTPFNLLIADIRLPGLFELGLIEALRERSIAIPVLVIASYRSRELSNRLEGLKIGEVLTKPCNSEELLERVASLLGRPAGNGEKPPTVNGEPACLSGNI